jgi:hypothetical protein
MGLGSAPSGECPLKEDRVSDREGRKRKKPHAVPGETSEECVAHSFHLLEIAKHPLPWVAVVFGRREETFKRVVKESISKVGASAEMSRDDRKSAGRGAIACVIEDADGAVLGNRHGRDGSLNLPGDGRSRRRSARCCS